MFFILSKILLFLVQPLTWVVYFLLRAIFGKEVKRKRRLTIGVIILLVFTNSFLFNEFALVWENKANHEVKGNHETLVVLGGYAMKDKGRNRIQFFDASDRLWHALEINNKKTFKKVVLSGGSGSLLYPENRESAFVSDFLKRSNISPKNLQIDSNSRNTYENAVNTRQIIGDSSGSILLVTSAFHSYRARKCFEKSGMKVEVLSSHFLSVKKRQWDLETLLLPSAKVLSKWNLLIKEMMGIVVYKLKGYI
jgi:uncharacterized SAM-binding protein YcdF (DUF218 family)